MTARRVSRRVSPAALGVLLTVAASAPHVARADDAACIAASEAEATLQKQVKFHEALKQLALCADPSCPVDVKTECSERIVAINAAMPTLVLAAADESGNDLVAVTVTLDGAPLATTLDGRALAIDPGSHELRFEAAGKPPLDRSIVLRQGEKDRHLSVVLGVPKAAEPLASPAVRGEPSGSAWSSNRTLALVSGGVGLVGLGVGAAFGLTAMSDWSTAKGDCNATSCSTASRVRGESARDSAVTAGDVSTAAFIVGAAGLAGGVVLWLTAPRGDEQKPPAAATSRLRLEPMMGPRGGGMTMTGSFQ